MDWVWMLYRKYIIKGLAACGQTQPTDAELEAAFLKALAASYVTVLVQEPWMNSVRFKGLVHGPVPEMMDLLHDPMNWLAQQYGGGKFKLNFHEGWNFVATQNFKPQGEPKWENLPAIDY